MQRIDLVTGRWRPLRGLSAALQVLFGAAAVLGVILSVTIARAASAVHAADGDAESFADAVEASSVATARLNIYWLAIVVIGVTFIVWMYRAAHNDDLVGRDRDGFSPSMAIGGWFIPFANIVIPGKQVAGLWRGVRRDGVWLVWVWWVLWVLSGVLVWTSIEVQGTASGELVAQGHRTFGPVNAVGAVLWTLDALAALLVVRRLTRAQLEAAGAKGVGVAADESMGRIGLVTTGAAAIVVVLGMTAVGGAAGGEDRDPSADSSRYLDVADDWVAIDAEPYAVDAVYEVGSPVHGVTPTVQVSIVPDPTVEAGDERDVRDAAAEVLRSDARTEVVDQRMLLGDGGNRLASLEWTGHQLGVGEVHGLSVIDVTDGRVVVAELITSERQFAEARFDVESYLLTLRAGG